MRKSIELVTTFALAAGLFLPQAFAQTAEAPAGTTVLTCATIASLEGASARAFVQGYLAGRRETATGLATSAPAVPPAAPAATATADAGANLTPPGTAGPVSPLGTPEAAQAASQLAFLDASVESLMTACQANLDEPLFGAAGVADPEGLAGPGAAGPD